MSKQDIKNHLASSDILAKAEALIRAGTADDLRDLLIAFGEKVLDLAWGAQQAKIDQLMLEWCPDEMTPEQIKEWGIVNVPST